MTGPFLVRTGARPSGASRPPPLLAEDDLGQVYESVRGSTVGLAEDLSDADATVQSMPDASPAKWHLAHTTWFFEAFVLEEHSPGYVPVDERYHYLFNSYYEGMGPRHPRPERGLLTRPSLPEVLDYRRRVDEALKALLHTGEPAVRSLVVLGLHHEQQHQELLLTDLLHLFSRNPLKPVYREWPGAVPRVEGAPAGWAEFPGGIVGIGHEGPGFAFDCESPRHRVLLAPYRLARRPVLNREWLDFMADGGYAAPALWLSDGWDRLRAEGWQAPLYWERHDGAWWQMTLHGFLPVDLDAPVSHVSFFEAEAYAHWAGARLPTEAEWEAAAAPEPVAGHFADSHRLRPEPPAGRGGGLAALYGDVWEWTSSAYGPYPGFRPLAGAIGEYNGKFMNGQRVLRGGSCLTPAGHLRATYRNYFGPEKRWQCTGVRLAADG